MLNRQKTLLYFLDLAGGATAPLSIQRRTIGKVAAVRARIARERETARALATQIEADMEAYLLGTKNVTGGA